MRHIAYVTLLMIAAAGAAGAQAAIDPGMTKDQVIARLGKPASEHSTGTTTYLYYANGQERKMGMSDMVALDDGKVVDAVFRSGSRTYTGKSSSPAPVSQEAAIAKGGGKAPAKPMKMPAPPAKAPDTRKAAPPAKAPVKTAETKKAPETAKKTTPAPTKKP